ncbi:MAG: FHA domain-containing protein [Deltaproteobacteria bacterium]|nr:FHA domain-containing protein [Deltaproteobacteria bacterium]
MPKFILKFQGVLIKEYNLDKPCLTIGRKEDNDICIDNMSVSGHHARIDKAEEPPVIYFTVTDLNSTNGTFVNGKRIAAATTLKLNDWITIGKHILYFK